MLALALPLLDSGSWLVAQADLDASEVGRGPVCVDVADAPVTRGEGFSKDSAEQFRGGEVCGGLAVWYEVLDVVDLLGLTRVYAAAPGLIKCDRCGCKRRVLGGFCLILRTR